MSGNFAVCDIVIPTAGRGKQKLFIILKAQNGYFYLVNGKNHKLENPKKKNGKHIQFLTHGPEELKNRCLTGSRIENSQIRNALSEFRKQSSIGGNADQAADPLCGFAD